MLNNDDRDIKIFGVNNDGGNTDSLAEIVCKIQEQRENGNAVKAERLGTSVADIVLAENFDDFSDSIGSLSDGEIYHIKLLFTFCAELSFRNCLDIISLSDIALGAMYRKLDAEFYENTTDAFTFYYLALRRANSVERRIGKRFAMLCGKENDTRTENLGTELYGKFLEYLSDKIDGIQFVR